MFSQHRRSVVAATRGCPGLLSFRSSSLTKRSQDETLTPFVHYVLLFIVMVLATFSGRHTDQGESNGFDSDLYESTRCAILDFLLGACLGIGGLMGS
jgi:hypothetical protein